MHWEGKHIVWDRKMQEHRQEAVSVLTDQGATNHLFSAPFDWDRADLLITDSPVVPALCIPVIRTSCLQKELCHEAIAAGVGTVTFIDKISRWKEVRRLARTIAIDRQPTVNEDIRSSLERLAGRDVLRIGREKFLTSAARYLGSLENNKNQPDWMEITKLLHTLKGSSGTIGATQVSTASREWEDSMEQHSGSQDFENQLYLLKMLLEYFRYHTLNWG